MKKYTRILSLLLLSQLIFTCKLAKNTVKDLPPAKVEVNTKPSPAYLSPEESMKSMLLPKGYHLELVASEPMVQEPVAIAWDGDGKMYVAEMNTYMQDVNGTGENEPVCRIVLLEDTNGDGKMDKRSVFVDNLVLPRMILPLDDRLLVNETYSKSIVSYRDTNGDGVADEKTIAYKNDSPEGGNLEHQKSGFVWNLDNWIYSTTSPVRYRYVGNKIITDTLREGTTGQWGLANDNYGRLYFSSAGGETPALGFQQNPAYGRLDFNDQFDQEFQAVWSIISTPDVEGGLRRLRPDTTLNHFTASCGQSVFRGDRLPADMQGDLFICEPVGRLIRRAKVNNQNGKITLKNAYDKQEFIASSDMNFRPVNSTTGPDGTLYIVDMYRGIIQESAWTGPGSYLRPQILRLGLDKNIGRGRIYRVVHNKFKPGKQPKLLKESNANLIGFLAHPNAWYRETAQKLLVVKADKSVVPALKKMALEHKDHLARIHALWTLEGLNAIDKETLSVAYKDQDPEVRKAAVWIAESFFKKGDEEFLAKSAFLKDDASADVRMQLGLSLRNNPSSQAKQIVRELTGNESSNPVLAKSQTNYENEQKARIEKARATALLNELDKKLVTNGQAIFQQLCVTCHGNDGKGLSIGGSGLAAPSLVGSKRITGNKDNLIKILLHGLTGPVDGKDYPNVMPGMQANDDEWIASVLSYVRANMGNKASAIRPDDVKKVRSENSKRDQPWTLKELE
jgi:mono/diheme cytochrome c family protein/glucose/arabinose dehydrogenase